ncbi:hypothetical protein [Sorangium sp. So ce204]|uniref:hypothetical protein n=1 Tax=Sorangium sp. So ce204 TaxID=3133288 RepID=UPI003F642B26
MSDRSRPRRPRAGHRAAERAPRGLEQEPPRRGAAWATAWESTGDARWAGELGLLELSLRRYRDAAEHLRRALDGGAHSSGVRERLRGALQQAAQEVVEVAIVVGKPEAELFMDGRRVGQGFVTYVVYVEPGSHEARATLQGHEDGVGRFEAQRGDKLPLGLALEEKPPAPRPAQPAIAPRAAAAAPGPAAPWPATGGTAIGPAIRVGGLALVSAGVLVSAGFAIGSAVKDGEAESLREELRSAHDDRADSSCSARNHDVDARCPQLRDAVAARDALGLVALASFVASGVVGAAALSSFWWAPSPDHGGVRVVPQATARGGGVRIEGTW